MTVMQHQSARPFPDSVGYHVSSILGAKYENKYNRDSSNIIRNLSSPQQVDLTTCIVWHWIPVTVAKLSCHEGTRKSSSLQLRLEGDHRLGYEVRRAISGPLTDVYPMLLCKTGAGNFLGLKLAR